MKRYFILAFCLVFPFEHEKQVKKNQYITFFIFDSPFHSFVGDVITTFSFLSLFFTNDCFQIGKVD